jgi:hypothetical protein
VKFSGLRCELVAGARFLEPLNVELLSADTVLRADGGITVTAFAEKLKMTRAAISRVVNGKAGNAHQHRRVGFCRARITHRISIRSTFGTAGSRLRGFIDIPESL